MSRMRVNGLLHRRLLDLGIVKGTPIEARFANPSGDPVVFRVRGADIALRKSDASLVEVKAGAPVLKTRDCANASFDSPQCRGCPAAAPRGPGGRTKIEGAFLVALAGNPNTGKSTVFNALTGLRQHVGNWPGKTVMRAEGQWMYRGQQFKLVDLPGTYSLLSTSVEEEIARDYILFGNPDCTVVVTDATCLERNLNLVVQILQITRRAVVCVNLLDEAKRKGIRIDTKGLAQRLGVPVVGTSARTGAGLSRLQERIYGVVSGATSANPMVLKYDDALEAAVDELVPEVEEAFPGVPNSRWIAMRLIDGCDPRLLEEIRSGSLASHSGQIGDQSLPAGVATSGFGPRRGRMPFRMGEAWTKIDNG